MTRYFGVGSVNLFDESSARALIQFANDFPWHGIEDFDQDFIDNIFAQGIYLFVVRISIL